ncbi:hypothetical protein QUB56_31840 [Microcoleus sp. AR_TQ3_B6]|uniref:hypothetical protein n=1 Tax=Microcoleus sp. AR_TQ3_B6 TaxID=3055284 RepID=UPI002FD158DA
MKNIIEEESSQQQELYVQIRDDIADQIIKHGLSKTESKLFFYLLKLDRFGDRPAKIKVAEILLATGIGKTAYHAAIAKFEAMGWFDFKHSDVEISNYCMPGRKPTKPEIQSELPDSRFGIPEKKFGKANSKSAKTNSNFAKANQKFGKAENEALKPSPSKGSTAPQTIQTSSNSYKTNQTLSEATRERNLILWKNFEEHDRNEIRCYARSVAIPKLPIKPTLEENWIASHCEELANQCQRDFEFQNSYYELQNSYRDKLSANSPPVEKAVRHSPSAAVMGQCQCAQCNPVEEEVLW